MFDFQISEITSTQVLITGGDQVMIIVANPYLLMSNVWWFAINLGPLIKIIIKEELELVVEKLVLLV